MSSQSPFNGSPIGYADSINGAGIALSGIDCGNGVQAGTKCFVAAGLQYWTLTVSAAAVDHVSVEAALNFPSMRWILDAGGGTVHVSTGISGDGSAGNPLVNTAPFGADTIVQINNVAASPVSALEVIASLTNSTAGTEASQWLHKLLTGGAQVTTAIEKPNQFLVPNGSSGAPGYGFLGTARDGTTGSGYGMWFDQTFSRLAWSIGGVISLTYDGSLMNIGGATGQLLFSSGLDAGIKRTGAADVQLVTGKDIVMGADGVLATNAANGHLEIPTCAGTPTGVVTARSGKACLIYDSTNFKLALSTGGGTWKQTAALT